MPRDGLEHVVVAARREASAEPCREPARRSAALHDHRARRSTPTGWNTSVINSTPSGIVTTDVALDLDLVVVVLAHRSPLRCLTHRSVEQHHTDGRRRRRRRRRRAGARARWPPRSQPAVALLLAAAGDDIAAVVDAHHHAVEVQLAVDLGAASRARCARATSGRNSTVWPIMCSSAGRANSSKLTSDDTGLPGRPNTGRARDASRSTTASTAGSPPGTSRRVTRRRDRRPRCARARRSRSRSHPPTRRRS